MMKFQSRFWATFSLCVAFALLLGCPPQAPPEPTSEPTGDATASDVAPTEPAIDRKSYPQDDALRLHHIQVKGTHNSYHLEPTQGVDEWKYSHKPLDEQLDKQGVRQFELDVYWNATEEAFLVYHIPILDQKSTCHRFTDCLKVIKKWSDAHQHHLPIFIFVEPKSLNKLDPVDAFLKLEKELLSVFPKERLITPDGLRKEHPDLKTAVAKEGWPTLGQVRGKICGVLLIGGEQRTAYTFGDKHLKGRLLFVTADVGSPYGAVVKIDGPQGDGEKKIQAAVKMGILVRTRADAGLEQAKTNDRSRLEAALRSGAHFLSTDYPAKVEGVEYVVEIPDGTPARCNPITAPASCTSSALE